MSYHSIVRKQISDSRRQTLHDLHAQENSTEIHPDSKMLFEIAENLELVRTNEILLQTSTHVVDKNKFISAIAKKLFNREWHPKPVNINTLKRKESAIGAGMFYTGRPNERIEFFNDSKKSWFFYQSITDSKGVHHSSTLHYEVHPTGIMRVSNKDNMKCEFVSGQEYDNFIKSATMYYERVMKYVYNKPITLDKTSK